MREERRSHQAQLGTAHILDAAEEVFAERGFVGTTIRQIAERAEFSVGGLYKLFTGGKEQLFASVVERRSAEYLGHLDAALAEDGPAPARLHAVVDETLRYFGEHATFFRLYHRASGSDQLNWPYFATILERYAGVFEQGRADGTLVADDPLAMAMMLAALQTAFLAQAVVERSELTTDFPASALHALVDRAFVVR